MTSTDSPPELSVVVVSWNTRDLLRRCLESLQADIDAAGLTAETIVVDNASSDGTPEEVSAAFPDVRLLIQPENLGFAAGNNLGIARASGRAVLILNPDTELRPGALTALWNALYAASHIGLVAPVLLNSDGSFQSAGFRFPGLTQSLLDLFPLHPRLVESGFNGRFDAGDGHSPFRIDHPLGACMLVRREVIEQVDVFDIAYFMYSEEIDWCQRITAAGWTILCAPLARVIHHGGQSTGQEPDRMKPQLHRSRARYLRTYQHPVSYRAMNALMSSGILLKRLGVPLPSAGRDVEELEEIASYYRAPAGEASDV